MSALFSCSLTTEGCPPSHNADFNKTTLNYGAICLTLARLLVGADYAVNFGLLDANSSLPQMPSFVHQYDSPGTTEDNIFTPLPNVRSLMEEMSQNLTISLLASPYSLLQYNETTTCYHTKVGPVWHYDSAPLITAYSIGVGVTILALVLGGSALRTNGQVHEMSFSVHLRTTRSNALDRVVTGAQSGAVPVPKLLRQSRLKLVRGAANGEHFEPVR